jgi:hypothetical protein
MPGSPRRAAVRVASGCLVAALALSACSGDGGGGDPPDSTAPTSEGPLALEVVIDNLQVSPTLNRVGVDIGDEVILSVTSDIDDTIHVHGVERQLVLTAGEQGSIDFSIPPGLQRGVYPVEAHDGGLLLFELRVR